MRKQVAKLIAKVTCVLVVFNKLWYCTKITCKYNTLISFSFNYSCRTFSTNILDKDIICIMNSKTELVQLEFVDLTRIQNKKRCKYFFLVISMRSAINVNFLKMITIVGQISSQILGCHNFNDRNDAKFNPKADCEEQSIADVRVLF